MHRRDLERAWYAARDAALAQRWGVTRFFRFQRHDGSYGDLALADRDACCWADAVDGTVGLRNSYGLVGLPAAAGAGGSAGACALGGLALPAAARRRRSASVAAAAPQRVLH